MKPARGFLSFSVSVPPKMIQALRSPQAQSVGGQLSGVRPRAQVALSLGPRLRPPSSAVLGSAGGYRGWRLPLRPLLASWGRLEVHWARSSDLGPLIFFLLGRRVPSSAPALPASLYKLFSCFKFPCGGGTQSARPGRPLAGREGAGRALPRRPEVAGRRGRGSGCADPTAPRGDALGGIPALLGREGRGVWFPRLRLIVPGGRRRRGVWEALVLSRAPS